MGQAVLAQFEADFGVGQEAPEKVTYIPLDGEGTVEVRVDKWVVSPSGDISMDIDGRRNKAVQGLPQSGRLGQGCSQSGRYLRCCACMSLDIPFVRPPADPPLCQSQGTIVAVHILSRLIGQGHISTPHNADAVSRCEWAFGSTVLQTTSVASASGYRIKYPKVGLLAMCGVHQGPFYSSTTSTVLQPYLVSLLAR